MKKPFLGQAVRVAASMQQDVITTNHCTHLRACNRAVLGAVFENDVGAIASHGRVNLGTIAAGFCQAPFAAARPAAIVHHRGVNGLAHHRFRLDAGMESSAIGIYIS